MLTPLRMFSKLISEAHFATAYTEATDSCISSHVNPWASLHIGMWDSRLCDK